MDRKKIPISKNFYINTYADKDFPIMNQEEFRRAKELVMFQSAAEFVRHSQLSKKAVTSNLAKNRIKQIGSWVALYLSPENIQQIKSYISGPAEYKIH